MERKTRTLEGDSGSILGPEMVQKRHQNEHILVTFWEGFWVTFWRWILSLKKGRRKKKKLTHIRHHIYQHQKGRTRKSQKGKKPSQKVAQKVLQNRTEISTFLLQNHQFFVQKHQKNEHISSRFWSEI